jgi:predicted DsbA family dithiol-disulfide isomerase
VKVEIWSDVVCPWCYIGKRHFEEALSRFDHADQVEVEWRSFELDRHLPASVGVPMARLLEQKYGMTPHQAEAANARMTGLAADVGLEYHLDQAQPGNTFDAHRLIHLAAAHGRGDAMKERLLAAYFTQGRSPSGHDVLAELAVDVGLERDEVVATLAGDRFADAVRRDEAQAAAYGVTGVPFFVIDQAYGVAGAQPPEALLAALDQAWTASHPITMVQVPGAGPGGGDPSCADGACAV